jgi:hypothetical protein
MQMKDQLLGGEYLITKDYTDWMVKTGGYARDMTMRDYYAGLAMQSLIVVYKDDKTLVAEYSERAYLIANAMLKERNK